MSYLRQNEKYKKTQLKTPALAVVVFAILWLSGCAITQTRDRDSHVFVKNDNFVVVIARKGDTSRSLARTYLGDAKLYWRIEDFQHQKDFSAGKEIVIPLKPTNPGGFDPEGYEKVAILCYHRFDDRHIKLSVPEEKFREQMQYLKDHDYRVIPLSDVVRFVRDNKPLPKRSVVITIDDGYRSTYDVAFKVLKQFNYPATVFLYTDFMGGSDALDWKEIKKMSESGLIDFQSHSKSHPNLAIREAAETQSAYEKRILGEITQPSEKIQHYLHNNIHIFAYPYGDTNDFVIHNLKERHYDLALTVQPGGTAAFGYPFMLRRTMIFGDFTLDDFKHALDTYRKLSMQ